MSARTTGPAMPEEAVLEKCSECHGLELLDALSDCSRLAPFAGRCCEDCVQKLVFGAVLVASHAA